MSNKKTLVVCGDSFNYGIGCRNQHTEPYGVLTADHFNWDLIRLARGSSSNYTTYLQGKYAASMQAKPHLVILGVTSYDRVEWLATGKRLTDEPTLENLNYHQYPPHHFPQPNHDAPMEYHLQNNPLYDPKILSEQVVAFSEYLKIAKKGNKDGYYDRLQNESINKIELIEKYYFDIFNSWIKRDYDTGVLMLAYRKIKNQGIHCIILSQDQRYSEFVDNASDFFFQDWGRVTRLWPDSVGSLHTGEGGHLDTANRLIEHINKHGLY